MIIDVNIIVEYVSRSRLQDVGCWLAAAYLGQGSLLN